MAKYLTGRVERTSQSALTTDRYSYLGLNQAEPNLGDPTGVYPSLPIGQQYQIVSLVGYPGERYWVPSSGLIPGSISVFDENYLVGTLSSITQLNFVGNSISAQAVPLGIAATITVAPPGNNGSILFKESGDFSTSSGLTFNSSVGILSVGNGFSVGASGTSFIVKTNGFVGIGTTNPTSLLDLNGDIRIRGTIYDYNNQPGSNTQILVKNNFGGLTWTSQGTIKAGAGGTYQNIQFHNNAALIDGASTFVYDEVNSRVGIGSTRPNTTLDVLGTSNFKGGSTIDNLTVTGITTTSTLAVSGTSTTRNLLVTGVTTIGFVTGTNAYFTGIVTASKFIGAIDVTNLNVTGLSTFGQKVNINSDLGVTGLTTTQNFQSYQSSTLNRLKATGISTFDSQVNINNLSVTGVGTFGNIKIDTNTVSTLSGNLILDSSAGTTQVNDAIYVNDATESDDKDTGAIIVEGGVGIEKKLNVGGAVKLASLGGITTTGGDLYVGGNLYLNQDIYQDEVFARNGFFTGILSTNNLLASGITTIATLGVTGLTTTNTLTVSNTSTFNGNVILGDASSDTVTYNSRINSSVLPSTNGSLDLGGTSNKWNNVYANTFIGAITGNADTATKLQTARNIAITGDLSWNVNFDGSANVTSTGTLANSGVSAGTYGSSTAVPIITVDTKGRVTGVSTIGVNFSTATVAQADKLTTGRTISISGDLSYTSPAFDGTGNVTAVGTLANSGVSAGTYGSSAQVGILTVDAKGRITAASNIPINFSTATVAQADKLTTGRTISISGDLSYTSPAFDGTGNVTAVGTLANSGVSAGTYGSSTTVGILTVDAKGRVTAASNIGINFSTATVQQADRLTTGRTISISGDLSYTSPAFDGTGNVTAVGTLANSGVSAGTYGSSTAVPIVTVDSKGRVTGITTSVINASSGGIGGITIQDEGNLVGTALSTQIVNFTGNVVSATSGGSSTANVNISVNLQVVQTSYLGTNPITVPATAQISIASSSNAYGTRYTSTSAPTTEGVNGDIWYQI